MGMLLQGYTTTKLVNGQVVLTPHNMVLALPDPPKPKEKSHHKQK